jgi:hypothetical protein
MWRPCEWMMGRQQIWRVLAHHSVRASWYDIVTGSLCFRLCPSTGRDPSTRAFEHPRLLVYISSFPAPTKKKKPFTLQTFSRIAIITTNNPAGHHNVGFITVSTPPIIGYIHRCNSIKVLINARLLPRAHKRISHRHQNATPGPAFFPHGRKAHISTPHLSFRPRDPTY